MALHNALRRMHGEWPAWFPFWVFWVLEGACQRHGVGGFIAQVTTITRTKPRLNEWI